MEYKLTGYIIQQKNFARVSKKSGKTNYWYIVMTQEGESKKAFTSETPIASEFLSVIGGRMIPCEMTVDVFDGGLLMLGDIDIAE